MGKTNIEWATQSWNPWTGCDAVSEGCAHCYAREMAETRLRGRGGYDDIEPFRLTYHPDRLEEPLHWRRGQRVFVCSMSDIGHPDIAWEDFLEVFRVMKRASQHKFLLLTKRPKLLLSRMRILEWTPSFNHLFKLPNVWFGVSAENQRWADDRIPALLRIPVHPDAGRFVSLEPMLEFIDIYKACTIGASERQRIYNQSFVQATKLQWVICGAETGAGKRKCDPEWTAYIANECKAMGIPFFGKKDGQGKAILPREFPKALEQGVSL